MKKCHRLDELITENDLVFWSTQNSRHEYRVLTVGMFRLLL